MIKIRLPIIIRICFIILCIGLAGCSSDKDQAVISENKPSEIPETNVTGVPEISPLPTDKAQIEPSNFPTEDSIDTTDYKQYLNKIWIVKNWDGEAYDYSSFFISKIENGVCEGKLSTASIAEPDFYFYSFDSATNLGDLSGTVNNGVAECQFSDSDGNKGNVILVFKENDEIEATIEYMDLGSAYEDLSLDGNYLFRPYNLADIEDITILNEHSFAVDLESWGSVCFVSGKFDTGRTIHPVAYLTNEHNDILYEFGAPFQTGTEIIEASIKDMNEDGLKDVMVITAFTEDPDIEHIEWIFLQMDDGLFYENNLNEEINISGEDTDMD